MTEGEWLDLSVGFKILLLASSCNSIHYYWLFIIYIHVFIA